ncbi:MAG: hypothetical protein AAGD11_18620 [Planctomycetota bacterium]
MRRSHQSHSRHGAAPIELMMALPMLTVLFMLLLTIAAAGVVCSSVEITAREQAWASRHRMASDDALSLNLSARQDRELQRIFAAGPQPSLPQRMLRTGKSATFAEQQQQHGLQILVERLPQANASHTFFHGTWDHREIRFDRPARHRELRLERRLLAFSPSGFSHKAFERLMP